MEDRNIKGQKANEKLDGSDSMSGFLWSIVGTLTVPLVIFLVLFVVSKF